jgi:hypothetical protein
MPAIKRAQYAAHQPGDPRVLARRALGFAAALARGGMDGEGVRGGEIPPEAPTNPSGPPSPRLIPHQGDRTVSAASSANIGRRFFGPGRHAQAHPLKRPPSIRARLETSAEAAERKPCPLRMSAARRCNLVISAAPSDRRSRPADLSRPAGKSSLPLANLLGPAAIRWGLLHQVTFSPLIAEE